jgi:AraC family transcriptional regulator, melibiose operon regulatory protein
LIGEPFVVVGTVPAEVHVAQHRVLHAARKQFAQGELVERLDDGERADRRKRANSDRLGAVFHLDREVAHRHPVVQENPRLRFLDHVPKVFPTRMFCRRVFRLFRAGETDERIFWIPPIELDGHVDCRFRRPGRGHNQQRLAAGDTTFIEHPGREALDFLDLLVDPDSVHANHVGEGHQPGGEQRVKACERAHADAHLLDADARVAVRVDMDHAAILQAVGKQARDLSQGFLLREGIIADAIQLARKGKDGGGRHLSRIQEEEEKSLLAARQKIPVFLGPVKHNGYPYRFETFGIFIKNERPEPMERTHSHCEIEMNLVERGTLRYQLGEEERVVREGDLLVFSGLQPHRLTHSSRDCVFTCFTFPITFFSGWQLDATFTREMLAGHLLMETDPAEFAQDRYRFQRWQTDLKREDPRYMRLVLLEARARIERLALSHRESRPRLERGPKPPRLHLTSVTRMIAFIVEHLCEGRLTLADIARAANLNPSYASTAFRREIGQSPITFLTSQRLLYAKFLLVTTTASILEIAFDCGFGSSSQFYAAFKRHSFTTPVAFRNAYQPQSDSPSAGLN